MQRIRIRAALAAALACAGVAGVTAPPAGAVETLMQDDAVVLGGPSEASVDAALAQMRALGVDRLRLTASWRSLAPARDAERRPAGFDPSDPGAYSTPALAAVDRAIRLATANGLRVMLDLAFGAPLWATTSRTGHAEVDAATEPDPAEFAAFARAMARRYSGAYVPPGAPAPLPRVDAFELWNEPNVLVFARPLVRGRTIVAADWYRRLVAAAYPAVKGVRPDAMVLIGSTAPNAFVSGGAPGSVSPLGFIRRLACVDESLRPDTRGACAGFERVPGDGFSHHPYALGFPPGTMGRDPDTVRIGDLPRLRWLLRALVARGRLAPGAAEIWLTEFGYETNFPVHSKPWTLAEQSRLLAQGEYLARRVRGLRNDAINRLRARQRLTVEDPVDLAERGDHPTPEPGPDSIDWIGDARLLALVERLPLSQRQVVVLRYMMDFNTVEIAELLDRSPEAVRQLHHRAMRYLRQRMSREEPETGYRRSQRKAVTRLPRHSPVLHARKRVALG